MVSAKRFSHVHLNAVEIVQRWIKQFECGFLLVYSCFSLNETLQNFFTLLNQTGCNVFEWNRYSIEFLAWATAFDVFKIKAQSGLSAHSFCVFVKILLLFRNLSLVAVPLASLLQTISVMEYCCAFLWSGTETLRSCLLLLLCLKCTWSLAGDNGSAVHSATGLKCNSSEKKEM